MTHPPDQPDNQPAASDASASDASTPRGLPTDPAALPLIHLVTPSYNQAAFLEQAIVSVLDQRYPRLRYGVIDGQSDDGSTAVIERYRDRLDFAVVEPDDGQSEAINKGLARCIHACTREGNCGDIVLGWLCSDDYLLPGALQTVGRIFADNPTCDWLIGAARMVQADGTPSHTVQPDGRFTIRGMIERGDHQPLVLPQPAIFWRARLTAELGPLDESLHFAMDFEYWLRFVEAGYRPRLIRDELAAYRLHDASKTVANSQGFDREHEAIERDYAQRLAPDDRARALRMVGYRTRRRVLAQTDGVPWTQLIRQPWWIGSQQVRERLAHAAWPAQTPPKANPQQPTLTTDAPARETASETPASPQPAPARAQAHTPLTPPSLDNAATPDTWDHLYEKPDPHLASSRLERERWSMRWRGFREHLRRAFGRAELQSIELGCGGGDVSILLAELGHRVTLLDFSDAALRHAQARFRARGLDRRATFVKADMFDPPVDLLDRFDVSVSLGVAEHFSGELRQQAIDAHRRVLRPGGVALISVPNAHCWPYRAWKAWLQWRELWPYGYEAPYTPAALRQAAHAAGLEQPFTYQTGFAASVDGCLLQPLLGRRLGWAEGPALLNRLAGWDVNLIATRPETAEQRRAA